MKKLLLPIEGDRYPRELLDFVCAMHPKLSVMLTAAFVQESDYAAVLQSGGQLFADEKQRDRMVAYNSRLLGQHCNMNSIKYKIHVDKNDFAIPCLRKESRYADLMLLSSKHFFEHADGRQPNAWMKQLLHRSECPVLLLPDNASLPGELILAYDGSAASVFAIRRFAALFPELCHLKTTLVYLNDDLETMIPEADSIRELGNSLFKKFRMLKLQMRSADFYSSWIGMMNNPWLISGSFGRPALSEAISGSFSDQFIRLNRVPLFVAHTETYTLDLSGCFR